MYHSKNNKYTLCISSSSRENGAFYVHLEQHKRFVHREIKINYLSKQKYKSILLLINRIKENYETLHKTIKNKSKPANPFKQHKIYHEMFLNFSSSLDVYFSKQKKILCVSFLQHTSECFQGNFCRKKWMDFHTWNFTQFSILCNDSFCRFFFVDISKSLFLHNFESNYKWLS